MPYTPPLTSHLPGLPTPSQPDCTEDSYTLHSLAAPPGVASCTDFSALQQYKDTAQAKQPQLFDFAKAFIRTKGMLPVMGVEMRLLGTGGYEECTTVQARTGSGDVESDTTCYKQSNSVYDLSIIPYARNPATNVSGPTNCAGAPLVEFAHVDADKYSAFGTVVTSKCQVSTGPAGGKFTGKVCVGGGV